MVLTGTRVVLQLVLSLPSARGKTFDCVPNVGVNPRPLILGTRSTISGVNIKPLRDMVEHGYS
ncbi:hypothetical protein SCLCIDRAFT_1223146 [Scleroderma citrinum Foug A]|uniref:Secreted protein n=1 Tax=Scleroderma citrinum Foug A TaxID=1036808 RepID=A0A0C2ZKH6_9AGAM|nr:hypothetical protein SCLCIDRAFT_1223146 [Scleroderma citrinum Foug A]